MKTDSDSSPYREATRRTGQLALWMLGWLLTLAAAQFGPTLWQSPVLTWAAIGLNVAVGVGLILAFTRYLRAVDDLDRKIMLDALAVTLGAAWVAGFAWIVADSEGLINSGVAVAVFPAAMGVFFAAAVAVGRIRYR